MVRFGDRSARMKAFYDVQAVMKNVELAGDDIVAAFRTTFANWSNALPDPAARLPVFDDEFAAKGEYLWRAWADDKFRADRRYEPQSFSNLVSVIEPFLMRCVAMARGDGGAQDWNDSTWCDPSPKLSTAR